MNKVLFSGISHELIRSIDSAKQSVDVAMAWFTNDDLFNALLKCLRRGVKVRLLLLDDPINWNPYAPEFSKLEKWTGAFKVYPREDAFMHHKFCVIDNKLVVTGSYNWTYYAETRNLENVVFSENADVVKRYVEEFNRLYSQRFLTTRAKHLDWVDYAEVECVDYDALNYETSIIASNTGKSNHQINSTRKVRVVDIPVAPKLKRSIYLATGDIGKSVEWYCLVEDGTALPLSKVRDDLWFYTKSAGKIELKLALGEDLFIDKKLSDLTTGLHTNKDSCKLKLRIDIDRDGRMKGHIDCPETNKSIQFESFV